MISPETSVQPRATEISRYLAQSGAWSQPETDPDRRSVFRSTRTGRENLTVVLPDAEPASSEMLTDALHTIAYAEDRPVVEVLDDLLSGGSDVLAVRLNVREQPGQIRLNTLIESTEALRQLLIGGTWSVADADRLVPPSRRSAETETWLKSTRVSTEPGSFILNAWLPLSLTEDTDGQQPSLIPVATIPFGRQVSRQLDSDVRRAAEAAQAIESGHADLSALTDPLRSRVNVSVLTGLAQLGGDGHALYDLRFAWSPRVEQLTPSLYAVTPDMQQVLDAAAERIREATPQQTTLRGLVVQLRRTGRLGAGKIVMLGYLSGDGPQAGARHVELELSEQDYTQAIHAHESGLEAQVRGELTRSGNRYRLDHLSGFHILPGLADSDV